MPSAPFSTYWSGIGSEVIFTPDATDTEITGISNTEFNVDESSRLAEVSNSQTGTHAARIAGLDDTDGGFTVIFDSALLPDTVGIKKGATGTLESYFGNSTHGKTQAIIIEKVAFKAVVQNGAIQYQVTYKGNGPVTNF